MSKTPLAGLRLGKVERELLLAAARSNRAIGAVVNYPKTDPAVAAARLRAARKLRAAGLLELERIPQPGRVRDRRREQPIYQGGCFWLHADPVRTHVHRRVVMWRTPLGDGVRIFFDRELTTPGSRIRWDDARGEKVHRYAEANEVPPGRRGAMLKEATRALDRGPTLDEVEGRLQDSTASGPVRSEYFPEAVEEAGEEERWRAAVREARRAQPKAGSAKLLAAAEELYGIRPLSGAR